ncbi:MAG: ATP-binding protein, partial [Bacteroidales bacterium]
MRFLNKVIFINSATINYSELNIDGNVHLIGTQGVGKSTALRAVLFFYNADKQRLGISKEKKSFDEYYFPYTNSYIIYEVVRDDTTFCVLAHRSQGRVAFRFIDAPYCQSHYINKDGKVFENWDAIKEAMGRDVFFTRKIDRYEEYRDIVFGNNAGLSPEFRRFSLIESKQYKNIPRTIQNVFLNSKLDAEFIKQTIIMSIDEDDIKIDLNSYLHHLEGFEGELSDIRKWTEKDKSGEPRLQKLAERVTETAASIRFLDKEKKSIAAELNYASEIARTKIPQLSKRIYDEQLSFERKNKELGELEYKWKLKNDEFVSKAAIFTNKLQEAKKKEAYYKAQQIDKVLSRVERKNEYTTVLESLVKQKQVLLTRYESINERFEALEQQVKNHLQEIINLKHSEKTRYQESFLQKKEELLRIATEQSLMIKDQFSNQLGHLRAQLNDFTLELNKLKIKEAENKHIRYYESDLIHFNQEQRKLNDELRELQNESKQITTERETLQNEWLLKQEKLDLTFNHNQEKLQKEIQLLIERENTINHTLDSFKGSFYAWLNKEYTGWEDTIGKVIDEQTILFLKDLNPVWCGNPENGLFGIKLNLSDINRKVKSAQDYEKEIQDIRTQIQELKNSLQQLNAGHEQSTLTLKEEFLPQIKRLKERILELNYTIEQNQKDQEKLQLKIIEFSNKANVEKDRKTEEIKQLIDNCSNLKLKKQEEIRSVEDDLQKQLNKLQKEQTKKIAELENSRNIFNSDIEKSILDAKEEARLKIEQLQKDQFGELSGKGVDTKQIHEIEREIKLAKEELDFIEKHRDLVIEYKKDRKELLDHQDEFKAKQKTFKDQMNLEKEQQQEQRSKLKQTIKASDDLIKALQSEHNSLIENIRESENFRLTDNYLSVKHIEEHKETDKSCKVLIGLLNQSHFKSIERQTQLQEFVHRFTGHFSERNVFKFKTNLIDQSEFMQFALDLQEFLDEHKIEEYQNRLNQKYIDIISLIGRETSDLTSRENLIQRIIKDINQDFTDRNFAGVIKNIAMRIVSSENKIMQLLLAIKEFSADSLFDLGEANLFSSNDRERKNNQAVDLLKK